MSRVTVVVDGEIVMADGRTIGWVVRRRTGPLRLRRRWFGVGLYKPHVRTAPHRGRIAAACALAHAQHDAAETTRPRGNEEDER